MLDKPPIKAIVLKWLDSQETPNKLPRSTPNRKQAFRDLVNTFKKYEYLYSDVSKTSIVDGIIDETLPDKWDKAKLNTWRKINTRLLEQSLIEIYDIVNIEEAPELTRSEKVQKQYEEEVIKEEEIPRENTGIPKPDKMSKEDQQEWDSIIGYVE